MIPQTGNAPNKRVRNVFAHARAVLRLCISPKLNFDENGSDLQLILTPGTPYLPQQIAIRALCLFIYIERAVEVIPHASYETNCRGLGGPMDHPLRLWQRNSTGGRL